MSKFSVGDRVVVVSDEIGGGFWLFRKGQVANPEDGRTLPVRVVFEDDAQASFRPDELEFEHIYDALSAEPLDEASFVEVKVDSRPEDVVNHPSHYTSHPSGVECIQVTEHMNFNLGNATKYVWRADLKSDDPIQDLQKARWYIEREIRRLGGTVG
jgi:hypothetical protein